MVHISMKTFPCFTVCHSRTTRYSNYRPTHTLHNFRCAPQITLFLMVRVFLTRSASPHATLVYSLSVQHTVLAERQFPAVPTDFVR